MKKTIIVFTVFIAFFFILIHQVVAQSVLYKTQSVTATPTMTQRQIYSLFKSTAYVYNLNLTIPTILEIPMDGNYTEQTVAVEESDTYTRQPVAFITKTTTTPFYVDTIPVASNSASLFDNNTSTFVEYQPGVMQNAVKESIVQLDFNYTRPITSSQLSFELDKNVAVPEYVELYIYQNGQKNTVITKQRVNSSVILFPQYTSAHFQVVFYHTQPLRITEMKFVENQSTYTAKYLRFLARPGYSYQIFKDADGYVPYQYIPEAGNLYADNANTKEIKDILFIRNGLYVAPDQDRDTIIDSADNCITLANTDQQDINKNNKGDACEDFDVDGIVNIQDNCPGTPNTLQQDTDSDGKGDHCDPEESRLIEQWKFLPWLGIVVGFGIVILLFKLTIQRTEGEDQMVGTSSESRNLQKK